MTDTTPLTQQQLGDIHARHARYLSRRSRQGTYASCPAHPSADDVPALLAEVDRLRAERDERLRHLVTVDCERERLLVELATAKAAGYRQAADNAAEQVHLHGADADAEMLLVFLQHGAELREQFAARTPS